jgi:23S rRNA pseudouridine2605 synthase
MERGPACVWPSQDQARVVLVRLQKFLAEAGVGSRRRCEELIQQGKVSVNGEPVTRLGSRIDPTVDRVTVGTQPVTLERRVYIAINKPAGVLCTSHDTHGRKRVLDLLPFLLPRLYTVGRLDLDSEGLLFLTNDGNFSLRLTHPRYKMPKTYLVEVAGQPSREQIARLLKGVHSEGQLLRAEKLFDVRSRGDKTELKLVVREGKKRHIRRMMCAIGHPVQRLVRLAIGPIELKDLKQGHWRYLTDEEVHKLMHR